MIAADIVRHLKDEAWEDEPIVARAPDGRMFTITDVVREPQTDDGEGHATSTGPTVWLTLEEL